jgi:hypothetical protein
MIVQTEIQQPSTPKYEFSEGIAQFQFSRGYQCKAHEEDSFSMEIMFALNASGFCCPERM